MSWAEVKKFINKHKTKSLDEIIGEIHEKYNSYYSLLMGEDIVLKEFQPPTISKTDGTSTYHRNYAVFVGYFIPEKDGYVVVSGDVTMSNTIKNSNYPSQTYVDIFTLNTDESLYSDMDQVNTLLNYGDGTVLHNETSTSSSALQNYEPTDVLQNAKVIGGINSYYYSGGAKTQAFNQCIRVRANIPVFIVWRGTIGYVTADHVLSNLKITTKVALDLEV